MKNLIIALFLTVSVSQAFAQPHNTKVIITGYMPNPLNADDNYEYVQLMALENIDFSKKNYSVIIAHSSTAGLYRTTAPVKGWATGTIASENEAAEGPVSQTTQFSLTSGQVNAGEYFYIGGSNKKLNGANTTDISEKAADPADRAKWIKVLDYNSKGGWKVDDGIGGGYFGSGALFANTPAPQGIAVFDTQNVTAETVPADVVFFGTALSGTGPLQRYYKTENGKELGYRICNTDRYDTANGEFFYKGANTFLFPPLNSNSTQSVFFQLGGVYDVAKKSWTTKREGTAITLPVNKTGKLSQIETGDNATKILSLKK